MHVTDSDAPHPGPEFPPVALRQLLTETAMPVRINACNVTVSNATKQMQA